MTDVIIVMGIRMQKP